MKKLLTIALFFAATLCANAQFEKGTKYVGASLSGLNLSYNKIQDFKLGLQGEAGYFFADNWMLKGNVGYDYEGDMHTFDLGAVARYYFKSIGLSLGAGAEYSRLGKDNNDVGIPVEVGYCFYLNKHVAIEPVAYYKMSIIDFGNNSETGIRVGFSYYF